MPGLSWLGGLMLAALALGVWPDPVAAWPAIQDSIGVHLCDTRPAREPDGQWSCRSGGQAYSGNLIEVSWGPAGRPGVPPRPLPPGVVRPYEGYGPGPYRPWGLWGPPRGGSGYDELDPWLGHQGGSPR